MPPSASFSVDVESGSAPLTVEFNNTSKGPVTSVEWDFGDGTSSTDNSPDHRYTIAGTHTVQLVVSGPGGADTVTMADLVTVNPGTAVNLVVSPDNVTLAVEEAAEFAAVATDQFGNVVPGTVTWSTMEDGGSIGSGGQLTTGTVAGKFPDAVKALFQSDLGELSRTASIIVESGPLDSVSISPSQVALDIGVTQSFSFAALDEFGNEVSDVLSSWSVSSDIGEIDLNGLLTSGTEAGSFPSAIQVEVVDGTHRAAATAALSILPDPLFSVEVRPPGAFVNIGTDQQFTATGLDQYGNEITDLAFIWESTSGHVDQTGLFTAVGQGDRFAITASAISKSGISTGSATVEIPPNFSDFTSLAGLNLIGDATQLDDFLRMTPFDAPLAAGGAWFSSKQLVADGFETTFEFRIRAPHNGDGLAFVIQNYSAIALGQCCSAYAGIPNSIAVEFDTWRHTPFLDPNDNHVSVHTRGTQPNTDHHSASIGSARPSVNMSDGAVHTVKISYVPDIMKIYLDDLEKPLLEVSLDIASGLTLDDGKAWVGLAAQKGGAVVNMYFDILRWTYNAVIVQ